MGFSPYRIMRISIVIALVVVQVFRLYMVNNGFMYLIGDRFGNAAKRNSHLVFTNCPRIAVEQAAAGLTVNLKTIVVYIGEASAQRIFGTIQLDKFNGAPVKISIVIGRKREVRKSVGLNRQVKVCFRVKETRLERVRSFGKRVDGLVKTKSFLVIGLETDRNFAVTRVRKRRHLTLKIILSQCQNRVRNFEICDKLFLLNNVDFNACAFSLSGFTKIEPEIVFACIKRYIFFIVNEHKQGKSSQSSLPFS